MRSISVSGMHSRSCTQIVSTATGCRLPGLRWQGENSSQRSSATPPGSFTLPPCPKNLRPVSLRNNLRTRPGRGKSIVFFLFSLLFSAAVVSAEVIDRVVAFVDDTAITLSEFRENYAVLKKSMPSVVEEEVLDTMINRVLLLKEAQKMRLEAPDRDEMLKDYIDVRIKSAVIIKEEEIERFYREQREGFKGKEYITVRDEIERYLFELETNRQLKRHLEELRSGAEISVSLKE